MWGLFENRTWVLGSNQHQHQLCDSLWNVASLKYFHFWDFSSKIVATEANCDMKYYFYRLCSLRYWWHIASRQKSFIRLQNVFFPKFKLNLFYSLRYWWHCSENWPKECQCGTSALLCGAFYNIKNALCTLYFVFCILQYSKCTVHIVHNVYIVQFIQ